LYHAHIILCLAITCHASFIMMQLTKLTSLLFDSYIAVLCFIQSQDSAECDSYIMMKVGYK